jgi:endoglucanase
MTTEAEFKSLSRRLVSLPTAPFFEHAIAEEVARLCVEQGLPLVRDRFGNLLIHLNKNGRVRPLVLAAHMDHPGFEIERTLGPNRWLARFRGNVAPACFREGLRVRLMPQDHPARLVRFDLGKQEFQLAAARPPPEEPRFAVWDVEGFAVRDGRIIARACDDLIGVATVLQVLTQLKRDQARVNVIGVLSRAEEVGFHGALALAAARGLPRDSLVVSLETSRELPGAKMGSGVVIRVGDKASTFDSSATRYLTEVASELGRDRPRFQFQRALMSGGTCEATAYQEFGYQCSAVCVALGNYHNCAPRDQIRAEYVSLADACSMADLLGAAANRMPEFSNLVKRLPDRLASLLQAARQRLTSGTQPRPAKTA